MIYTVVLYFKSNQIIVYHIPYHRMTNEPVAAEDQVQHWLVHKSKSEQILVGKFAL